MNILLELNYVREMLFIPNNKFYTNRYDDSKNDTEYYQIFADSCYEYYLDSSEVLSNLSASINALNSNLKTKLTTFDVSLSVLKKINKEYIAISYDINIYSAFHELNHALYHISQIKKEDIITYDDNVYYFLKNGLTNILMNAENQVLVLSKNFTAVTNKGVLIVIICIIVVIICYVFCFLIFKYFYQKVEERKQSYLAIFYEIESKFIITFLTKCEKFSRKIQAQENNETFNSGEKISIKNHQQLKIPK